MKRQLQGLVFLLSALFLANATHCGVVGRCVARATVWLIGTHGMDLLVGGLAVLGLALTGIAALIVRAVRIHLAPQPVRRARVITVQARSVGRVETPLSLPERSKPAEANKPTLRAPIKQQEVIGGLKYLGYTRGEIDSVLGRLKGSTEEQLRVGIKLLQRAA